MYVLAFTGVRGDEILKDSRDDRRVGLRWADVDIKNNQIPILGKNQQREPAQLPGQTRHPLEQLRRVVEPASEEWPVFISLHAPSMYKVLPNDFDPLMMMGACWITVEPSGLCRQHCLQTVREAY